MNCGLFYQASAEQTLPVNLDNHSPVVRGYTQIMSRFKRPKADSLAGFRTEKTEPTVPLGLLKAARKSGQLNLTGRGLTEGNFDVP